MPGPPPTPLHLRVLRGNPSKRPLPSAEPQPPVADEVPQPPAYLHVCAVEEWNRAASGLHVIHMLTVLDTAIFAAYCQAYARWRLAEEALQRIADTDPVTHGLLIRDRNGGARRNPLAVTAARAADAMLDFASHFGMTPATRARIAAGIGPQPPSGPGKFDGLLA